MDGQNNYRRDRHVVSTMHAHLGLCDEVPPALKRTSEQPRDAFIPGVNAGAFCKSPGKSFGGFAVEPVLCVVRGRMLGPVR
jgi:hypothetical protein